MRTISACLKYFRQWLLLVLLLMATSVHAINNSKPYIISVSVSDYSQQELFAVLPSAMSQALTNMSGDPQVVNTPMIAKVLEKAQDYMQSYHYSQEYQNGMMQLWVTIVFNHSSLIQLLQQADQRLWASHSWPQLLLWVKTSPQMINNNDSLSAFKNKLLKQAARHGLNIILPEMDLEDDNMVGMDERLLFNNETLQKLAKRYGVNAVLVGQIEQGNHKHWSSQWKLLWQTQVLEWKKSSNQQSLLATAVLQRLFKELSQQPNGAHSNTQTTTSNNVLTVSAQNEVNHSGPGLEPNSNSSYGFMVRISGVNNLSDYTHAMNYLRHLSVVTNVSVSHMEQGDLVLQVQAIGGKNALISVLLTSSRLRLLSEKSANMLHYQWKKKSTRHITVDQQGDPVSMHFINDKS